MCLVGIANLTQVIMTLVTRCSYAGKVCAGDYLPDSPGKELTKLLPYYEQDDGQFMMITPIMMLVSGPIICCMSVVALPLLIVWSFTA